MNPAMLTCTNKIVGVLFVLAFAHHVTAQHSDQTKASPEQSGKPKPPHIILLLADDLGWGDVGYHNSPIKTPHVDALAATGTRLNRFYVMPVCSPTRGALMTGRYPMRLGLQCDVVRPWAQHGLPTDERTLPQALREVGYKTAIVGKWHLGHNDPSFLPTARGFDLQYGHYNGNLDYFTHVRDAATTGIAMTAAMMTRATQPT